MRKDKTKKKEGYLRKKFMVKKNKNKKHFCDFKKVEFSCSAHLTSNANLQAFPARIKRFRYPPAGRSGPATGNETESSLPSSPPHHLLLSAPPKRFGILDGIEAPSFALLANHARLSSGFDETSVSCWSLHLLPPLFFVAILSIDPPFLQIWRDLICSSSVSDSSSWLANLTRLDLFFFGFQFFQSRGCISFYRADSWVRTVDLGRIHLSTLLCDWNRLAKDKKEQLFCCEMTW